MGPEWAGDRGADGPALPNNTAALGLEPVVLHWAGQRETETETDRETERQRDRVTERQRDRETE